MSNSLTSRLLAYLCLFAGSKAVIQAQIPAYSLSIEGNDTPGALVLDVRATRPHAGVPVHSVQWSSDLSTWTERWTAHGQPVRLTDRDTASNRFYRVITRNITDQDDAKNVVTLPGDEFANPGLGIASSNSSIGWIK